MRIGILTFHCAYNYGAMLQSYALQEFLLKEGYYVHILNYRPNYLASKEPKIRLRTFITRHPKRLIHWLFTWYSRSKKHFLVFKSFEDSYYQLMDFSCYKTLDCIIIGSDQVWNKKYNGNDPIWYGCLSEDFIDKKIITYAASAGNADINNIDIPEVIDYLKCISSILVREKCIQDKLKEYSISSDLVLDPSLMANPSLWEKWYTPIRTDNYIITYQAREDENVFRIAKSIAQQLDCKIITMDGYGSSFNSFSEHVDASPDQFVSLIKNAKCVITTSFHGTAFSLITNTPFYTLKLNDGADGRATNLLEQVGLIDRLIDKELTPIFSTIDFSNSDNVLDHIRKESQTYLLKALQK